MVFVQRFQQIARVVEKMTTTRTKKKFEKRVVVLNQKNNTYVNIEKQNREIEPLFCLF